MPLRLCALAALFGACVVADAAAGEACGRAGAVWRAWRCAQRWQRPARRVSCGVPPGRTGRSGAELVAGKPQGIKWRCALWAAGQNIRKLVKDGFVIRKPQKIHSRARARTAAEAKAKGRHTGYGASCSPGVLSGVSSRAVSPPQAEHQAQELGTCVWLAKCAELSACGVSEVVPEAALARRLAARDALAWRACGGCSRAVWLYHTCSSSRVSVS